MNKKQTSHRSIWKYTLILPVVAILLFLNCTLQTKAEMMIKDIQQPDSEMNYGQQDNVTNQDKKHEIFNHVEIMPSFPGGDAALLKWLTDNVKYPKEAQDKGIQGRVSLRFVITPDGSIEDVRVLIGIDAACDKEAVRAINTMPKWNPGKQNGNPVYVYFNLPVIFRLQNTTNPSTPTLEESTMIKKIDDKQTKATSQNKSKQIFNHVEVMPSFPGGDAALLKWLSENVKYLKESQEQGIQGRVNLRFVVAPDGSIEAPEVVKGFDPGCDNEALQAVKNMPKWNLGKQNGNPVYVYFNLPVTFTLQNQ